jgi:hypothetical protein
MRGISVTALLISNLAYAVIFVLTAALAITVAFVAAMFADIDRLSESIDALKASPAFMLLLQSLACGAAAVGGGYVAARLGRERPWLQSALALSGSTLIYLIEFVHGPLLAHEAAPDVASADRTFATVYLFVGPLLGMLGGYLALLRQARLDAMSPQERSAHTLAAAAIAVLRWIAAFPAAAAAFAIMLALARLLAHLGPYAFIIGVMTAILVGTLVAPPAHRKFAGFMFVALALLIPIEEIGRHVWFGGLTGAHAMLIGLNMVAAGFAYVALRRAFPQPFATHPGQWWWILDLDLGKWSPDERSARRGLAVTAVGIWIVLFLFTCGLLQGQGFDANDAVPFAFALTLPIGLIAARPAYARMAPDLIWRADQNAALRLQTHGVASHFD